MNILDSLKICGCGNNSKSKSSAANGKFKPHNDVEDVSNGRTTSPN
jgi:major membrane immunogen (membrane-anchored lipoprotein)